MRATWKVATKEAEEETMHQDLAVSQGSKQNGPGKLGPSCQPGQIGPLIFRGPIFSGSLFATQEKSGSLVRGHLIHFGGTKNDTSGARIKILRPLL